MNPIHPTQARKLLDSSKAAVFGCYPFTLILNTEIENLITYPLTLNIDPCSKFTGISLVTGLIPIHYEGTRSCRLKVEEMQYGQQT